MIKEIFVFFGYIVLTFVILVLIKSIIAIMVELARPKPEKRDNQVNLTEYINSSTTINNKECRRKQRKSTRKT